MAEPTLSKRRYVPLIEASKLSGYTGEYIERLCRIGKIPCLAMGEKIIVELDGLLRETGTILVRGENIGFIEVADGDERYPSIAKGTDIPQFAAVPEEVVERTGSIAIVGEMVHSEEGNLESASDQTLKVKFPSNALPYFSSMGKVGSLSKGIHIPVSGGEKAVFSRGNDSHEKIHLAIQNENQEKIEVAQAIPPSPPMISSPTLSSHAPQFAMKTMQSDMGNLVHQPLASPNGISPGVPGTALEPFDAKLPIALDPKTTTGKVTLAALVFGLLVLPTTLGVGGFFSTMGSDVGEALHSSTRALLSAVGAIPQGEVVSQTFPYLTEMSQLLSAAGISQANTQEGVVLVPSTGNSQGDSQIRTSIQGAFSDPVEIVSDGKDGKSGIIRPIFQHGGGGSYLYLMVPVGN